MSDGDSAAMAAAEAAAESLKPGSISINSSGMTIHASVPPGVTGPKGPAGGSFASGGMVTTGTIGGIYDPLAAARKAEKEAEEEAAAEEAARTAELVLMPSKLPKKVLVAFIEGDGEGDTEPFWAAYLEPRDIDTFLSSEDSRDCVMKLELRLVKKWEQ